MVKRLFDILFSLFGLILLFPFFVVVAIFILVDSKGDIFYRQTRIGKNNAEFRLFKFRTMQEGSEKKGLLTVGGRDPRVTSIGYYLRKMKIDELPQLINVLIGDMSLVGPRPEVKKYVDLYTNEQKKVLSVRPGITDYASIEYIDENELLSSAVDPESEYIKEIMPAKLNLNLYYIKEHNLIVDLKIIFLTLKRIITRR